MVRNYQAPQRKRGSSEGKGQFLMLCLAFVTGYMSSSIFNVNQLSAWLNHSLNSFGWHTNAKSHKISTTNLTMENQPKLEFYTILTKEPERHVPVGTELAKMVKPNAPVVEAKAETVNKDIKVVDAKPVDDKSQELATQNAVKNASQDNLKGQYVVQLASFRYAYQAEKFRAKLLLKGFDVKISAIRQGPMQWYRVMLGPYRSVGEAQKAKIIFQAKEHSVGMVRQMDA